MGNINNKITIFVGLDLSFNSTGITLIESINKDAKHIKFNRLVFNPENRNLSPIFNVNQLSYNLPRNANYKELSILDLMYDNFDLVNDLDVHYKNDEQYNDTLLIENYNIDQLYLSTKIMMNSNVILTILNDYINTVLVRNNAVKRDINLVFNIEGNILTTGGEKGNNQLRVIGGLIMLNQDVRKMIIANFKVPNIFNDIKLFITSPTELKMYFTNNGRAEKQDMVDSFILDWDGKKLIPETHKVASINDVVDSFALAVLSYDKYFYSQEYMDWLKKRSPNRAKKKVKKPRKPKIKEDKLALESLPNIPNLKVKGTALINNKKVDLTTLLNN